jgi:hypothetical protein
LFSSHMHIHSVAYVAYIDLAGFNKFNIWPDNIHLGTDKPEQNL